MDKMLNFMALHCPEKLLLLFGYQFRIYITFLIVKFPRNDERFTFQAFKRENRKVRA